MIKRINLIEKTAFNFTYLRLVQIGIAVLVVIALIIGYQAFNTKRLNKILLQTQTDLKTLQSKRDVLMKTPVKKKVSVGQYQELFDRLDNTPSWSNLINEITNGLPSSVWLTSFKSIGGVTANTNTKTNTKDKSRGSYRNSKSKSSLSANYKISVSGMSSSMQSVTAYASKLSQSKYLSNIKVESQKAAFGFSFTIVASVETNVK